MGRFFDAWKKIHAKNVSDAMSETGLDWGASKRPVHFKKRDDTMRTFDGRFVVARDDNDEPLSVTGKNYRPLQNLEAFSMFGTFVDNGTLTLERGGCLGKGISTFLVGTLSGSWSIGEQELELKVAISNDYSGRRSVRLSVVPVVDEYYMPINISGVRKTWSIWHTTSLARNLERAQTAINDAYKYATRFCTYANTLCQEHINRTDARDFFNRLLTAPANEGPRGKSIREGKITSLMDAWDRLSENKNTRWGLLQAVSSAELDRAQPRPGETESSSPFIKRRESLLKKMLNGNIPLFSKAESML